MRPTVFLRTFAIAVIVLLIAISAMACSEDREPQDFFFRMTIEGGSLTRDDSTLIVNQDDTVTIDWTSDMPLLVHLHGYNIETQLEPGVTAPMSFVADATGRFDIYVHAGEGVLTNDSGEDDADNMDGMGNMDSSSMDHSEHVSTDSTAETSVRERRIATLEVRP